MPRIFLFRSLLACLALATTATAKTVPVVAVSLMVDGTEVEEPPTDRRRLRIYGRTVGALRKAGFAVLPTSDVTRLVGGEAIERAGIARLHADLRAPEFTFNVVLLPPRWSKTKAGEIRLEAAGSGKEIWSKPIKVAFDRKQGEEQRLAALEKVGPVIAELRPMPRRTDPALDLLLEMNDIEIDDDGFVAAAGKILTVEKVTYPTALVEVAADHRLVGFDELRLELLRRAVLEGGPSIGPVLGRCLVASLTTETPDDVGQGLILDTLDLVGYPPGHALAPHLDTFTLERLLHFRRKYDFGDSKTVLDKRIATLALEEANSTRSFDEAEAFIATLPLDAFDDAAAMQLRDILYGHLTPNDPAASYRRLVALFPETDYAPPSDDHFDEAFLKGATRLKSASLSQRMAYFREYIATSQKARASDRLATSLDLEKVLANKLATAVRNAKNAKDEERAATQVYGVDRGPRAYQAIGRTFVEVLGDNAKKDRLLSLLERYPDVPEVVERVQRDGILRDREGHSVRVELGDAYDEIHALHGGRKENHVTRLDLTPAAFVGSKRNVPNATKRGLSAYAIDEDTRLLLQDGRVIRITMRHYEPERYHHGIRIGDTLDTLIQSLGEPDYTRSLMFGRQIATWRGLHGGSAEVSTVFDSGKVVIFYEQDTELTRQALARTWRKSE